MIGDFDVSDRKYISRNRFRAMGLMASMLCLPVLLSGCSDGNMQELQSYVAKTKADAKRNKRIEPLPTFVPYETYSFKSGNGRDPFAISIGGNKKQQQASDNGIRPDPNRRKEALEEYPLDSLRMVGTLERDDVTSAIIKASDGTIHRVKVGNYMGQNYGRIIRITDDKIDLVEIIPNGLGGWRERESAIALSEE